jgi:hypothetical protein
LSQRYWVIRTLSHGRLSPIIYLKYISEKSKLSIHIFTHICTCRNATEIGWLDITKGGGEAQWERRWFELKDGVIRHAPSNDDADAKDSVFIPIENIIRLVTDNKKKRRHHNASGGTRGGGEEDEVEGGGGGGGCGHVTAEHLITMKTTHEKLILRAETSDDLNRYYQNKCVSFLFPLVLSIVLVLVYLALFLHH